MEVRDEAMQERPPRIELDRPDRMVCQPAEIAAQVEQQIHPGREQQRAAHHTLERDQPEEAPAARRIGCRVHHPPLSPRADRRAMPTSAFAQTIGVLADAVGVAIEAPSLHGTPAGARPAQRRRRRDGTEQRGRGTPRRRARGREAPGATGPSGEAGADRDVVRVTAKATAAAIAVGAIGFGLWEVRSMVILLLLSLTFAAAIR